MSTWLAINANLEFRKAPTAEGWWCLPFDAKVGDVVFFYLPRATSKTLHGLFAEYVVTKAPNPTNRANQCSAFASGTLGYTELGKRRQFSPTLTTKEFKKDATLGYSDCVRHNFQGTTFKIAPSEYSRLVALLKPRETP